MGYLICEKCGGYYELQSGERPEDFDKCNCGGQLIYSKNSNYIPNSPQKVPYISKREEYWKNSRLRKYQLILFIIASAVPLLGAIYLQLIHPNPFKINLQSLLILFLFIGINIYIYKSSSKIQKRLCTENSTKMCKNTMNH